MQLTIPVLPPTTQPPARLVLWARGARAFGDGFVSLLLPVYLIGLGFDAATVSLLLTATLLGSAGATMGLGLVARRFGRRQLLLAASAIMIGTGLGFATLESFWPLLLVALVGTLNPSSGDVSLFLPLEHTVLSHSIGDRYRTALYARYSLIGSLVAALGSLATALPDYAAVHLGLGLPAAIKVMFLLYGGLGLFNWLIYRRLPVEAVPADGKRTVPLGASRGIVLKLAALFSLDAFAGGLFVQSLLALWLYERFDLSLTVTGSIFFWASLASAISYLAAASIAARFGLINTMVFTHLPSNLCIMALPFVPQLWMAIALLLIRGLLSQMDVPTRTSYVMAVVTPEERPAAASMTAVPRSLAGALGPLVAGYLPFGWPLILGGALKVIYDLSLLAVFRKVKPPEERERD